MQRIHKTISVFFLAMLNVAVIMSLRGLPLLAKEGPSFIFFLLFSAIFFVIPTSLIAAELATGWPGGGGVYRWVKEAFGDKMGFTAIWLQWIQNIIWYPSVLAFAAGSISYLFLDPALASSKIFNVVVILTIYWGATFVNFRGIKASSWFSSLSVMSGTIIPGIFMIVLGFVWFFKGEGMAFPKVAAIIPDFRDFNSLAFLAGVILLFAGIEVSAVHANNVKNPKRDYPKAILLAIVITLVIFSLGAFSIAAVIPAKDISLTAGIMEAFRYFLNLYKMGFLLPVMGFLITFGVVGGVAAWIVGPSKGLHATGKYGHLPPVLGYLNKYEVPSNILIFQGIIVTGLSLLYLFMPTVSSAFFLLTALAAILYLVMYIMMYLAAIKLRYTQKDVERTYKIPFKNVGMWVVSLIGIIGALFAIVVGFFPPSQLTIGSPLFYVSFIVIGIIVFGSAPFIIIFCQKHTWKINK
jgi:putative glutamate/gamma-aminobutyrate antiporter